MCQWALQQCQSFVYVKMYGLYTCTDTILQNSTCVSITICISIPICVSLKYFPVSFSIHMLTGRWFIPLFTTGFIHPKGGDRRRCERLPTVVMSLGLWKKPPGHGSHFSGECWDLLVPCCFMKSTGGCKRQILLKYRIFGKICCLFADLRPAQLMRAWKLSRTCSEICVFFVTSEVCYFGFPLR